MTTVTLAEVREKLPDLLRLVTEGEEVVITEDGKWVAAITIPPKAPPTTEEIAAAHARAKEAVIDTVREWINQGRELSPDSPLLKLLEEGA